MQGLESRDLGIVGLEFRVGEVFVFKTTIDHNLASPLWVGEGGVKTKKKIAQPWMDLSRPCLRSTKQHKETCPAGLRCSGCMI